MKVKGGYKAPWLGPVVVIAFAVLAAPFWIAESAEPTAEDTSSASAKADWVVYVEDGHSEPHAVDLLPASTPLENYAANLARISPGFSATRNREVDCAVPGAYDPQNITVTEIGPWHSYTVFDLANIPARHRSIVLKDQQGNYRILYTQVCWGSATADDTPHFVTVQGQILLVYRSETGGSGGYQVEYYFQFDPESRRPVALSLTSIDEKLKEILPKGAAAWSPGGFDIVSLSFASPVWRESDATGSPTGGRVTMKLEIRDKALVVTEAKYEPDPKAK